MWQWVARGNIQQISYIPQTEQHLPFGLMLLCLGNVTTIYMCACIYVCVCICVCVCTYVCVCICVWYETESTETVATHRAYS